MASGCHDCRQREKKRPHYHPWSIKEAIHHVQPPVEVLESIITLRIHFDDTDESNGVLEVIPASHDQGKFTHAEVQQWVETKEKVLCEVKAGDVVMMQPTTLHASKKGTNPFRRRVLHIEYSAHPLEEGLEWYEREEVQ